MQWRFSRNGNLLFWSHTSFFNIETVSIREWIILLINSEVESFLERISTYIINAAPRTIASREIICEMIRIVMLNNGSLTFHSASHNSNSVIDLTIIHSSMALDFNWEINEDPWESDYFPIRISFNRPQDSSRPLKRLPRLYSCKIDWDIFQINMDQSTKITSDFGGVDVVYSSFVAIIENALTIATPGRNRCKEVPNI